MENKIQRIKKFVINCININNKNDKSITWENCIVCVFYTYIYCRLLLLLKRQSPKIDSTSILIERQTEYCDKCTTPHILAHKRKKPNNFEVG